MPLNALTPKPIEQVDARAWTCVDFISDVHLSAQCQGVYEALNHYLMHTPADAVFILGDLLEVWIGDDCLEQDHFEMEHACAHMLKQSSQLRPTYFMPGNRDFLIGQGFMDQTGMRLLCDPCVLETPSKRILLSHGDELCTSDVDYQAFRREVRSNKWQADFLGRPLSERHFLATQMRAQSQLKQSRLAKDKHAELDPSACIDWLERFHCELLIHGHTHRPMRHELTPTLAREVLSDWETEAAPQRGQALRLANGQLQRIEVF